MRRSKKLRLALLGVTPLALFGCGKSSQEALVYNSIESCVKDSVISEAACKVEYNKAWQHHLMNAPKYQTKNNCEQDFSATSCQQLANGEFIPTMEGFMLERNQQSNGRSSFTVIPLYLGNGGYYRTSSYDRISPSSQQGRTTVSSSDDRKVKPTLRSSTMSRGGFGSRSAARGSWGG